MLKFCILNKNFKQITLKLQKFDIIWIYKLLDEYISPFDKLENPQKINSYSILDEISLYPWITILLQEYYQQSHT